MLDIDYNRSRDGYNIKSFQNNCFDYNNVFVFMRLWDYERSFGVFFPQIPTTDTDEGIFIFSLNDKHVQQCDTDLINKSLFTIYYYFLLL